MTTSHRSRLGLLRLVLFGTLATFAVPVLAASTTGSDLFESSSPAGAVMTAPPPELFAVVGVAMVAWAIGRRHFKSLADLRRAESEA